MQKTVGDFDSTARVLVGAVLGAASLAILGSVVSAPMLLAPVLGVAALIMLVTGVTGLCPLYSLLGFDTRGQGA